MATTRCHCPTCHARLKTHKSLPAKLKCPQCRARFTVPAVPVAAPVAERRTPYPVAQPIGEPGKVPLPVGLPLHEPAKTPSANGSAEPQGLPMAVPVREANGPPETEEEASEASVDRSNWLVIIGVIAVLFLALGIGLAVYCFKIGRKKPPAPVPPVVVTPPTQPAAPPEQNAPPAPAPEVQPSPTPAPARSPPPVLTPEQIQVNQAIDHGVEYLKAVLDGKAQDPGGFQSRLGRSALAGLTLLSCGVPAHDPMVTRLAAQARAEGPRNDQTYDISLVILFLDRLGDPRDRQLIQSLGLRLIGGQNAGGGWTYTCRALNPQEEEDLLAILQPAPSLPAERTPYQPGPDFPTDFKLPGKEQPPTPATPPRPRNPSRDLVNLPVVRFQPGQKLDNPLDGDNSNTQFGLLGVWTARKYGVPVERSLAMVETRFRTSQNQDGSWNYSSWAGTVDSMTCAGLLGLAVGRGIRRVGGPPQDLLADQALARGLAFLGEVVGKPGLPAGDSNPGNNNLIGARANDDLYFLWSLERVGVIYDLPRIGGRDWYAWGAPMIVDHQNADGSWGEAFPGVVDTCFALLFLRRVNVATDLTSKLKLLSKPQEEPGPGIKQTPEGGNSISKPPEGGQNISPTPGGKLVPEGPGK